MSCPTDRNAGRLDVGVSTGFAQSTGIYYTSTTRTPGIIDEQVIPVPVNMQPRNGGPLANGLYQIVDLTNPYGLIKETGGAIGSVSCTTVNFSIGTSGADFGLIHVPVADATPATCYLPSSLDPMLTGPGGSTRWPARTRSSTAPSRARTAGRVTRLRTTARSRQRTRSRPAIPRTSPSTPIANGSPIPEAISATGRRAFAARVTRRRARPRAAPGQKITPPAKLTPAQRRAVALAKTRTRTALRKVFGTGLSHLSVACRLRTGGASTCTVSWRKSSARYSGHVYLRNHRVNGHLRWQYRIDVTRKKGTKTTHVRRDYRTGGSVS